MVMPSCDASEISVRQAKGAHQLGPVTFFAKTSQFSICYFTGRGTGKPLAEVGDARGNLLTVTHSRLMLCNLNSSIAWSQPRGERLSNRWFLVSMGGRFVSSKATGNDGL